VRRLTSRSAFSTGSAWLPPFVDLLTILLVFLLKSWSSDAPVRPHDTDFALPTTTLEGDLAPAVAVDVTAEAVFLRGVRVAGAPYYLERDDDLVVELYAALQQLAVHRILIRADEDVPYRLLRKLVFTAREAGVDQVAIVAESASAL